MVSKTIENILLSEQTQTIISIVSYILLIFTTFLVGHAILKKFTFFSFSFTPEYWSHKASLILIFIWILLLYTQIIKLSRILKLEDQAKEQQNEEQILQVEEYNNYNLF
jgi:amino acid transporter